MTIEHNILFRNFKNQNMNNFIIKGENEGDHPVKCPSLNYVRDVYIIIVIYCDVYRYSIQPPLRTKAKGDDF